MSEGIRDFAPELAQQPGVAQRFMENRLVVRIYERAFRPAITRVVTRIRYADEAAFLQEHVHAGPALDLACGTGRYTRWLSERLGADQVVGLDLSRPMLRRAVAQAPQLQFVRGSAMALPLAARSLGTVVSFGALHLFPDPEAALHEVARVLVPGGHFVCLTAVANTRWQLVQKLTGRLITLRFMEPSALRNWCEAAQLEVVSWNHRGGMLLFAARLRELP